MDRWEHFSHGADMGVRGRGRTLAEAFAGAALAMTAIVVDPAQVRATEAVDVLCRAPDREYLLVEWLNSLVTEMGARRMLFSRFDVQCDEHALSARAWGEPVDVARHQPAVEVKGATLTELVVRHEPDGTWLAQCVVDV
jgi:tRNA nucleotidyltransferase (CCA-adding enzyme)